MPLSSIAATPLAPIGAIIGDNMAHELRAVVDELGGEAVFGRRREPSRTSSVASPSAG
jgi:hypothetical protein